MHRPKVPLKTRLSLSFRRQKKLVLSNTLINSPLSAGTGTLDIPRKGVLEIKPPIKKIWSLTLIHWQTTLPLGCRQMLWPLLPKKPKIALVELSLALIQIIWPEERRRRKGVTTLFRQM